MKKTKYRVSGKKQLLVMTVVLVLMIVALVSAVVFLYKPNTSHNNEELPFSTDTSPIPDQWTKPEDTGENQPDNDETVGSSSSSGPVYTARDEVYNFLIIGHDRVATLADVIMLVNYDVNEGRISIMQLPRDTYFAGDSNKPSLNVQFSAYYNRAILAGEKKPAAVAADKFAAALEKNLCIKIHYTAVMNLDGFADIVNAIGGVDLYIPYDMEYNDPEQDLYINFKKGQAHLNGNDAEKFIRYREGYIQADIGRGNAQKIFLAAFIEKAKNSVSITNLSLINSLATEVISNLTTDMSVADAVYFAKNALSVDMSKITLLTIPGDSVLGYYVINRGATLAAINAYFNVYDNDILNSIFDKSCLFTNTSSSAIASAYFAENAALINEFNAQNIRKNSIKIPMKTEN